MKSLITAVAIAFVFAAPVASFAQSGPTSADAHAGAYSAQGQNAQTATPAGTSGYGSTTNGSSQTGYRAETTASSYSPPVYIAH